MSEADITPMVKNEKAFKMIAEKMNGKTLEEIAAKNKVICRYLNEF
jgi:hypothetical protein